MRVLLLMIFMIHPIITNASGFSLQPTSVTQAEGVVATFLCQHPQAVTVGWIINGTPLIQLNPTPQGIIVGKNGGLLNITALFSYNGTEVRCLATLVNGTVSTTLLSTPANLIVQGVLDSPGTIFVNSTTTEIAISWEPSFSLNLTTAEPDIAYCVDIYNVTGGGSDYLISDCNVIKSNYTFTVENSVSDPRDLFQFIITPRSNMEGARNGTPSQVVAGFFIEAPLLIGKPGEYLLIPTFNGTKVEITIMFNNSVISNNRTRVPENYTVEIQLINPLRNGKIKCLAIFSEETGGLTPLTLNCNQKLRVDQLGVLTLSASNRAGSISIIRDEELSTHDIQNVSVVAVDSKPGEALIGCSFVSGSNSMGYLAIITDKNTSVFQYHVVQRQEDQQIDTISNLATGEHRALLFSVQSNGMPQAASVNLPRNVSIINGALVNTTIVQPSHGVTITESQLMNNEKCYTCAFSDNSDPESNCVAVAHPCGVNSLYPDLFNITTVKFIRDGSQAVGCIDISQCMKEYRVAVFYFNGNKGMVEGLPIATLKSMRNDEIPVQGNITAVVVVVIILLLAGVVIAVVVIILYRRKSEGYVLPTQFCKRKSSGSSLDDIISEDKKKPTATGPSVEVVDPTSNQLANPQEEEHIYSEVEDASKSKTSETHYVTPNIKLTDAVPKPYDTQPRTEYADVCGYKNHENQAYAMLGKQNSKEGTPDDLHKVVYSQVKSDTQTLSMAPDGYRSQLQSLSPGWSELGGAFSISKDNFGNVSQPSESHSGVQVTGLVHETKTDAGSIVNST